jgi:hypothetical protein
MSDDNEKPEVMDCFTEGRFIIDQLNTLLNVPGTSHFALRHEGAERIIKCIEELLKLAEE